MSELSEYTVAVIRPNNFKNEEFDLSVTQTEISEVVKPYVELINVNRDNMMEVIVKTIGLTKELIGATNIVYQDENSIYQICHLNLEDDNKQKDDREQNGLCTILTIGDITVRGPAILLRSDITSKGICTTASVSPDNIVDIVYKKTVHRGVKVSPDGELTDFFFRKDPMESYNTEQIDNFQWMELPLFKLNLIVFIQVKPVVDKVNKKITQLVGREIIHGESLIVLKSVENEFLDVPIDMVEKLLIATLGPVSKRDMKEEELKDGEKKDNLPIVMNGYHILNNRVEKYKNRCGRCNGELTSGDKKCSGCFRLKYCSRECQIEDWYHHKGECLNSKKPLNYTLTKKQETVLKKEETD